MRVILVSINRILHQQWKKALHSTVEVVSLYNVIELKKFPFESKDIIIFDYDNLEKELSYLLSNKVICLSSKLDNIEGFNLLKKGIKAYGNNYMTPMNLAEVIKTVSLGKIWISPDLMSFIIKNSTLNQNFVNEDFSLEDLTTRELEVAQEVSKGHTNKVIAQNLNITERTVKAHISTIFSKLDISDRVSLGIKVKEYLRNRS